MKYTDSYSPYFIFQHENIYCKENLTKDPNLVDEFKSTLKLKQHQYYERKKEEIKEKKKEYREKHKEEIKEKQKKYREEHKDEINDKRNARVKCECGKEVACRRLNEHRKTALHMKAISSLP